MSLTTADVVTYQQSDFSLWAVPGQGGARFRQTSAARLRFDDFEGYGRQRA